MKILRFKKGVDQKGINLDKIVDFKMILSSYDNKYHFKVRVTTVSQGDDVIVIEKKEDSEEFMKAFYNFISSDRSIFDANSILKNK